MAHKAPGKHHREGISLMKLFKMFPYHKMSPKHLHRYVDEFSGRHNYRLKDTIDQMSKLVTEMAGKQLRYADLIANNELPSGARS